jgi:hypothetical protein
MGEREPNSEKVKAILSECLTRSYNFLDDFSNEIPDKVINSTDENRNYKVRKGWFNAIFGEIGLLQMIGYLESGESELVDCFLEDYGSKEFSARLTTENDIQRGDQVLKFLICYIENLLKNK